MSNNTPNTKSLRQAQMQNDREVEVLYQKMGDRWFAFSLIDDEVFVGSIAPEELKAEQKGESEELEAKNASTPIHGKTGSA